MPPTGRRAARCSRPSRSARWPAPASCAGWQARSPTAAARRPSTARASANRPWNSSACEKITSVRASPRSSPSVAERRLRRRQALVRLVERAERHRERPEPAQRVRLPGQVAAPPRRLQREPVQPGAVVPVPAHVVEGPQHDGQPPGVRVEPAPRAARSVTLSSTWYSSSSQASADAFPPNVSGRDAAGARVEVDQLPPGVQHPVRGVRGVQVVVEHPPRGARDALGRRPLLGGVGAQQVMEREPPGHDLHEQRRPGEVAQRDPGLRDRARPRARPPRPR